MNKREYSYYREGYKAGEQGKGISDCPRELYGPDAEAWRDGLWAWLSDQDGETERALLNS
jgi:hypothetical protein